MSEHDAAIRQLRAQVENIVDTWLEFRNGQADGIRHGRRRARELTADLLGHTGAQVDAVTTIYELERAYPTGEVSR